MRQSRVGVRLFSSQLRIYLNGIPSYGSTKIYRIRFIGAAVCEGQVIRTTIVILRFLLPDPALTWSTFESLSIYPPSPVYLTLSFIGAHSKIRCVTVSILYPNPVWRNRLFYHL